jgi:hypothetical protein
MVLLVCVAALLWWRWPEQDPDAAYEPRAERPTWTTDGPAVLIDDAHWNSDTSAEGLTAFAALLGADGYRVLPDGNATRAEMLADARIGVVVNPRGLSGIARGVGAALGLPPLTFFDDEALWVQEMETTVQWVENGGSLLLAVDEGPPARGALGLAARFGVALRRRLVIDLGHSEPRTPERLVFSRENHLLGSHPIVDGFPGAPAVNRVVTFGGQALVPPPDASILLLLGMSASERAEAGEAAADRLSVAGLAQAIAIERGRGRVVVLGDAAVITARVASDGQTVGLGWPGSNNERFARYIMRWLSRRDDR